VTGERAVIRRFTRIIFQPPVFNGQPLQVQIKERTVKKKETAGIEEKGAENKKEIISVSVTLKPVSPESKTGFRRDRVKNSKEAVSTPVEVEPESGEMALEPVEREKIDRFRGFIRKEMENISLMVFSSRDMTENIFYIITN
jgi:hypothetical protein